jgi:DNA invertase Pin-like site-specific DNA recombinase
MSGTNDLNVLPGTESRSACGPLWTTKIQPSHRERLALVYVRQSSPQQVLHHRESAELQYRLSERAAAMGWPNERIRIIDDDQGLSGRSIEGRNGFQRLLSELGQDRVGLVLGIEMSRLARSCKDRYHLLEICALFGALLADQDGVYDPRNYNDRLLLGLKGTMSEAELHILQGRMLQGKMNKAERGELFSHAPAGYMRDEQAGMMLKSDEQARHVVQMVFDKFHECGSINAVLRYLSKNGIRLGLRPHCGAQRGQFPSLPSLLRMSDSLNKVVAPGLSFVVARWCNASYLNFVSSPSAKVSVNSLPSLPASYFCIGHQRRGALR